MESKTTLPLVSVIMNCRNCGKYLRESIDSVLAQSYVHWEIIFWDNQSTDDSAEIFKIYTDQRLKYFLATEYTALGKARNLAIEKAKGLFIAFLDCDDLWSPVKLEKQIPLFSEKKVGLVISDAIYFNHNGQRGALYKGCIPPDGWVFSENLTNYRIALSTAVVRRSALMTLDHLFDPELNLIEEYDLFVRLSYTWKLACINEKLAQYRIHGESMSFSKAQDFPVEYEFFLRKIRNSIPSFEDQYPMENIFLERNLMLSRSKLAWKAGQRNLARELLRPYRKDGLKWRVLYLLTWLRFETYVKLRRMMGGVAAVQPRL